MAKKVAKRAKKRIKMPRIVCLCGSTKFYEHFQRANYNETMAGRIVLSVGFFPHSSKKAHGQKLGCTEREKKKLDRLHKRKIDLADEVLVINVKGYVGSSTRSEIEYAKKTGKKIRWLDPCKNCEGTGTVAYWWGPDECEQINCEDCKGTGKASRGTYKHI
jgi:DnaJ-class molecular chaperone